jgi:peptidyl-prolyl cis-trans isomerase C
MRKFWSVLVSLCLIAVSWGTVWAEDDVVVAKIGDRKITLSEFNKILNYYVTDKQKASDKTPQFKEAVLKHYLQAIAITQAAGKSGFDKKPEIIQSMEINKSNYLASEYLKKEVIGKITIPDNEIKTYYETHPDEFKTPEMVKASHILIKVDPSKSADEKNTARAKAEDLLKKIKAGEDFSKLASEKSDDTNSKLKGGDLGFLPKGKTVKQFDDVAFSLKPGEISGVVETQFGYHIIKVEEKKAASTEPYESVKEKISQKLLQEQSRSKQAEFLDSSMKDAKIEMYPEAFGGGKKK